MAGIDDKRGEEQEAPNGNGKKSVCWQPISGIGALHCCRFQKGPDTRILAGGSR